MSKETTHMSGYLNVRGMAAALGVPVPRLCEGLGFSREAGQAAADATVLSAAFRPIIRSLEILGELFHDPDAVRAWLRTPHPDLDGDTALGTILSGQAEAVCIILEHALAGIPV